MICYKDMSFCAKSDQCANLECRRNTKRHDFDPDGMPVCYIDIDISKCQYYKEFKNVEDN
jgi:hypothetical protein